MPRKISEQVTATGAVSDFTTTVYMPAAQGGNPVAVAVNADFAAAILSYIATSPAEVTFADMRDGTADDRVVTPLHFARFKKPQELDYAATVTIDYGATDDADLDDGLARSIRIWVDCTGDCTVNLDNVSGLGLLGETIEITLYNDISGAGGAKTFAIATANGITVTDAPTAVNPGVATAAGSGLRMWVELRSATAAVVLAYQRV